MMGICRHGYMSHGYMSPNLPFTRFDKKRFLFGTFKDPFLAIYLPSSVYCRHFLKILYPQLLSDDPIGYC